MNCSVRNHPLTFIGSNLHLYTEVGRVHGDLGSLVYGLHAPESRRVLLCGPWRCRGAEEDLSVVRLFYSDMKIFKVLDICFKIIRF